MVRGALHPKMSKLQDILLCHFGELKDARDAAEAAAASEAPHLTARPITHLRARAVVASVQIWFAPRSLLLSEG